MNQLEGLFLRLTEDLKHHAKEKSLRQLAKDTKLSPATLSRLLNSGEGSKDTFVKLFEWRINLSAHFCYIGTVTVDLKKKRRRANERKIQSRR